ncbi:type II secretion system protein [Pseudoxanthomonas suwonensis]
MMRRSSHGFSFIELIACLAIVSLLLMIALPVAETSVKRTREGELRRSLLEIRQAIDRYKEAADAGRIQLEVGASGYPPDLQVLVDGVVDQASPSGRKMYFLRRIPRDPMYPGRAEDNAQTWGLRSYASPADAPEEGTTCSTSTACPPASASTAFLTGTGEWTGIRQARASA